WVKYEIFPALPCALLERAVCSSPEHASARPRHDVGLLFPVPARAAGAARDDADRLARARFQFRARPLAHTHPADRTGAFRRGARPAWHVTGDQTGVPAEAASPIGALGAAAEPGALCPRIEDASVEKAVAGGQPGLARARFAALAAGGA